MTRSESDFRILHQNFHIGLHWFLQWFLWIFNLVCHVYHQNCCVGNCSGRVSLFPISQVQGRNCGGYIVGGKDGTRVYV